MVVDTHIFLWYILDDPQLEQSMKQRMFEHPETVFVPAICFWEAMMLHDRGRLDLGPNPVATLTDALRESGFQAKDLNTEIAMLSRTLSFAHDDPADRFIASTAFAMNLPLATADTNLRQLEWLRLA